MKRYFNLMSNKEVVVIEFAPNSAVKTMDITSLFGTNKDIVEITKREFVLLSQQYQRTNETNMTMTIIR